MLMRKDKIYRRKQKVTDFNFRKKTAEVFDDMLQRSVPFYGEMQRMIGEIALNYAKPGTCAYDLGCSTGTTLVELNRILPPKVRLIGVDFSYDMLARAKAKLHRHKVKRKYQLRKADLDSEVPVKNASVVILMLTLQFIRPMKRKKIMEKISRGLNKGGCLILVEKVVSVDSSLNRLFIKHYCDFKRRQGYSLLEIAQKRESLENVLIPYHPEENRQMLLENGFRECDTFFKWYNFCGMIALK